MRNSRILALALAAGCTVFAACGNDENGGTNPPAADLDRVYVQIERLGNPLVSEVLFAKRNHPFHNATSPNTDVTYFTAELKGFVSNVAGRDASVGNTLAAVLLPDELVVDPTQAGATAGWLGWAFGPNYGGRKLDNDVVDTGLGALFGYTLGDSTHATPCLSTDNVDVNDRSFPSTFPYLAAPH